MKTTHCRIACARISIIVRTMPTLSYIGTPVSKQGFTGPYEVSTMAKMVTVDNIPATALLPRIGGGGPLKDISNSKQVIINNCLQKVPELWTAGKGRHQTKKCEAVVRLCLQKGYKSSDIAEKVALKYVHLGHDFTKREYWRATEYVDRIKKKLWVAHISKFNSNSEDGFYI